MFYTVETLLKRIPRDLEKEAVLEIGGGKVSNLPLKRQNVVAYELPPGELYMKETEICPGLNANEMHVLINKSSPKHT